ncbi:uncharacterized protein B0T15DRAFT_544541 [Chaetomium strumarium]|uniref:Uncharacterized protein n=1 Tax=Chaetomium strumarium TaxID=1170767 RepID=A0AAJ0LXZ8_9PEZI|nr:hypothetical protein B0T15DRAFT_544541 [Chaetomium strumarium]
MAPRQHTFTLVPNPLGMQGLMSRPASGPQSKPPMTSKQAQKLYKQANRGPRLSKAEQRRLEREEQERIRRDLDKEKQASRARALREKKKEKEQQVLQEKKRRGLPLVDVRPSQDTIARFVRGNGVGNKRDSAGVKVGLPVVQEEANDDRSSTEDGLDENVPPGKAQDDTGKSKRVRLNGDGLQENNGGLAVEGQCAARRSPSRQLLVSPEHQQLPPPSPRKPLQEITNSKNHSHPAQASIPNLAPPSKPTPATSHQTQSNTPVFKRPGPETSIAHLRSINTRSPKQPSSRQARQNLQEDSISLPTSTQLFVISHIDDLFPTPSQEARELEEAATPLRTAIAGAPPALTGKQEADGAKEGVSSKDKQEDADKGRDGNGGRVGDTHPGVRKGTINPAKSPNPLPRQPPVSHPRQFTRTAAQTAVKIPTVPPPPRPTTLKPPETPTPDLPFICTQDLLLSSQDLRDLDEPSPIPSKTSARLVSKGPPVFKKNQPNMQSSPSSTRPPAFRKDHFRPQPSPLSCSGFQASSFRHPTPHLRTKHPVPANAKQHPAPPRSSKPLQENDANNEAKADPVSQGWRVQQNNSPVPDRESDIVPQHPPSHEKPRFFGSSGSGVELLLAMDQSRKAHEEEERKRRAEREAQQKASRQEKGPEPPHRSASRSEHNPQTRPREQCLPLAQNSHAASGQLRTAGTSQPTARVTASQETDYGELGLDVMDLLDLEMGKVPQ